jgi:hypothetical protein
VFVGQHLALRQRGVETEGVLFEISSAAFASLLDREPATMSRFMQRSFAYLLAGEQQLMQSLRRRNEDLHADARHAAADAQRAELRAAAGALGRPHRAWPNRRGLYRYLDESSRYPLSASAWRCC